MSTMQNKRKAYVYKMSLVPANVLSIVILVLGVVISVILHVDFGIRSIKTLWLILGIIGWLMLHEFLHGVGYFIGGTKIKNISYGICLEKGIFYAMAYQELTKKNILISLQMPFMVIGVITYIIGAVFNIPFLVLLSIINLSGASMDLMMFYYISRLPKDTTYSESGNPDEFVLITSEDLSKKKYLFVKLVEEKEYNEKDYKFSGFKKLNITKASIIILVVAVALGLISFFI